MDYELELGPMVDVLIFHDDPTYLSERLLKPVDFVIYYYLTCELGQESVVDALIFHDDPTCRSALLLEIVHFVIYADPSCKLGLVLTNDEVLDEISEALKHFCLFWPQFPSAVIY